MKFIDRISALSVIFVLFMSSCIRDEAPNSEADIISCSVPAEILAGNVVVDNYSVRIRAKKDADISNLAPVFTISEGATIVPESGSVQDFQSATDNIVYYTVTSADGQWTKRYPVRIINNEIPSDYNFSGSELFYDETNKRNSYYVLNETDVDGNLVMTWATGNPGYQLTGMADVESRKVYGDDYRNHSWEFYPTAPVFKSGSSVVDYVRLVTRSTGSFGKMVGMPIAAGNLFQGMFELQKAIADPRGATNFGETYFYFPIKFSGRYRYKAGDVYTDENGNEVAGKKDTFSIYALFFETETDINGDGVIDDDETIQYINGSIHDDDFKNPHLISIAMLEDPQESDDWIRFELPFVMFAGKTVDNQKLVSGKCKLGIVISSSVDGDYFKGAVGSTLDVADLKIEKTEFR